MQKSTKIVMLLAIIAIGTLGTDLAYGETSVLTSEQVQTVQIIAVTSTIAGALVSVGNGYANATPKVFSLKKSISAIITAITGAMLLVNLGTVPEQTSGITTFAIVIVFHFRMGCRQRIVKTRQIVNS